MVGRQGRRPFSKWIAQIKQVLEVNETQRRDSTIIHNTAPMPKATIQGEHAPRIL